MRCRMNCSQVTADMAFVLINSSPIPLHLAVQSGHKENAQPWVIRIAHAPPLCGDRFIVLCREKVPGVYLREEDGNRGKSSSTVLLFLSSVGTGIQGSPMKQERCEWQRCQQQEGTQRGQSRRCGSTAHSEHSPLAQSELDLHNFGISAMWEEGSPHLLISSELGREIWRNFLRSPRSKQKHPSQRQSVTVCMGLCLPGWIKGCWTPTDPISGGTDTSFIQNTNTVVFLCSTGLESNTVTGLFFLILFLMDCIILWLSRWTNNLQWIIYPTDFDSFAAYWISMSRPWFQLAYLLFEFIWHVPLSFFFFFPKTLSTNQRQLLKKFDSLQLKVVVAAMNQGAGQYNV